jgi:hypothetical protein
MGNRRITKLNAEVEELHTIFDALEDLYDTLIGQYWEPGQLDKWVLVHLAAQRGRQLTCKIRNAIPRDTVSTG